MLLMGCEAARGGGADLGCRVVAVVGDARMRVVYAGTADGTVWAWDPAARAVVHELEVRRLAFTYFIFLSFGCHNPKEYIATYDAISQYKESGETNPGISRRQDLADYCFRFD